MPTSVVLTTSDEMKIAADVYPGKGEMHAILLHMMPATKESWKPFAHKLQEAGYTSIAIDGRGHGESTQEGTLLYETMPDKQQRAKIHDVEAAFAYLKSELGATEERTVVIGASIGANLAIQFLQMNESIPVAVALSPGINYRGVKTPPYMQKLAPGQTCVLVASDDDAHSFETIHTLRDLNPEQTVLVEMQGIGHGTIMTDNEPALIERIISELP